MEEFKQHSESSEQHLQLGDILKKLFRVVTISGMEGEKVDDPIAQEIVETGPENLKKIEYYLQDQGVTDLVSLQEGHGSSAVVLDAGDKVVRLSRMAPTAKPDVPQILRPLAAEIIGGVSVQICKKLQTSDITKEDVQKIQNELLTIGYRWDDAAVDNLGRDENNNLFIIDGSVLKI